MLTNGRTDVEFVQVDQNGDPVLGSCFQLAQGSYDKTLCDTATASGGLDGRTLFERVTVASAALTQTTLPFGSAAVDPQTVTITPKCHGHHADDSDVAVGRSDGHGRRPG